MAFLGLCEVVGINLPKGDGWIAGWTNAFIMHELSNEDGRGDGEMLSWTGTSHVIEYGSEILRIR